MSDSDYILAADVGNSRIKFGVFKAITAPLATTAVPASHLPACLHAIASPVSEPVPWDRIMGILPESLAAGGIIAGSNPAGVEMLLTNWPAACGTPRVIGDRSRLPLAVDVDFPEKVGIDRLLNAVAANAIRPADRPAIIVDSGTATTVDYVRADGAFAGGAILPGIELSARSLHRYTALLPLLSLEDLGTAVPSPLGRNTRDAIRSGLLWGQLGAVKELVERLGEQATAERREPPLLLLTGGGAPLLARWLPSARWEPNLALQGLVLAAETCGRDQQS